MNENLKGWENISNKYSITENNLDIIIVLAGGLNEKGELHEWVVRRMKRAVELHKIHNIPILCCGGGTYHKPPYINDRNFIVHESTECVNYLVQCGIDKNSIYREWSSYDTIANAFFSLTNHLWCNSNWKNIGVITSEFHIERTKEIFDWIYNLDDRSYNLQYFSVSDLGLDQDMLECRREREENSKENVLKLKTIITTIQDFHQWIYKEHNAYNNNFLIPEVISNDCNSSY